MTAIRHRQGLFLTIKAHNIQKNSDTYIIPLFISLFIYLLFIVTHSKFEEIWIINVKPNKKVV